MRSVVYRIKGGSPISLAGSVVAFQMLNRSGAVVLELRSDEEPTAAGSAVEITSESGGAFTITVAVADRTEQVATQASSWRLMLETGGMLRQIGKGRLMFRAT